MEYDEDGFEIPSGAERKNRQKPGKKYSRHYKGDNSGGYGNPPVGGQFGNRNPGGPGRPKGSTSLEAALKRAFRRKMGAVRDGKPKKLNPTDIFAQRILETILGKNSSPRMIELGRSLMERYGPQMPEDEPKRYNLEGISHAELEVLNALLARVTGDPPGETKRHVLGMVFEPYPTGDFLLFKREDGHLGLKRVDGHTDEALSTADAAR